MKFVFPILALLPIAAAPYLSSLFAGRSKPEVATPGLLKRLGNSIRENKGKIILAGGLVTGAGLLVRSRMSGGVTVPAQAGPAPQEEAAPLQIEKKAESSSWFLGALAVVVVAAGLSLFAVAVIGVFQADYQWRLSHAFN